MGTRKENLKTLIELGLNYKLVKDELLSLLPQDYSEGPIEDFDQVYYKDESIWIFGKSIQNKIIYIKLKIRENKKNEEVICISFHIAKYPMKFPFK
ncbi:MAG: hypothetical protein PHX56_08360 [Atribacterota bacterium]|nr:hypothetical protein [Atribacterota bacterium]MDD4289064.1 hypothetical protein [Atribacterota bacterium]MDI9596791.1 hypothetical protein [Atribacterota bacterium]